MFSPLCLEASEPAKSLGMEEGGGREARRKRMQGGYHLPDTSDNPSGEVVRIRRQ